MNPVINRLILKSNRSLGANLVEAGLIENHQLEEAGEVFVRHLKEGRLATASILRALLYERQVLKEEKLLAYQFEHCRIGGMNLNQYQLPEDIFSTVSLEECLATWSLPVDLLGDTVFMATASYLSDFVRQYWEERMTGTIVWLACPFEQLEAFFEARLESESVASEGSMQSN